MLKSNSNLMIFILTIGVFSIINTEMGVIGILPLLAERFGVSIPQAGFLISLFALAVAFSGPVMPLLFSGMERKKVMLLVLGLFALGNIAGRCTDNFAVALAARVLPAFLRCQHVRMKKHQFRAGKRPVKSRCQSYCRRFGRHGAGRAHKQLCSSQFFA